jgi:hypothetical protein
MNSGELFIAFVIGYFLIPIIIWVVYRKKSEHISLITSSVAGIIAMVAFIIFTSDSIKLEIINILLAFVIGFVGFFIFYSYNMKKNPWQFPKFSQTYHTRDAEPQYHQDSSEEIEPPYHPQQIYRPPKVYDICPACGGRGKYKVDDITCGIAGSVMYHHERCNVCNGMGKVRVQ